MNFKPRPLHSPADTLLVFALRDEAQDQFDSFDPLYCGVGKVNAAYRLTAALARWRHARGSPPSLVLNLGSAGSPHFNTGAVVNCTQFIQRDFDATALGYAPHATPFEQIPPVLENGLRHSGYAEGTCGTGDSFATDGADTAWNVADMEAYALAKVCLLENVLFCCFKYITDGADRDAAASWQDQLGHAAKELSKTATSVFRASPFGNGS